MLGGDVIEPPSDMGLGLRGAPLPALGTVGEGSAALPATDMLEMPGAGALAGALCSEQAAAAVIHRASFADA